MQRVLSILFFLLAACAMAQAEPLRVLATLFPIQYFAQAIGGGEAEVSPLLPPGAEPHTYAPTPSDMLRVSKTDLLLYASPEMEVWISAFLSVLPKEKLVAVVPPAEEEEEDGEENEGDAHHHGADPHTWLDPVAARQIVRNIADAFSRAAPADELLFRSRAAELDARLQKLHADYQNALAPFEGAILVSGGHFAFGPLARRYHLKPVSPYAGFSPDAQPSPRTLARLVKQLRETHAKAIFHEDALNPKTARVLAEETGALLLRLNSMHSLTKAELANPSLDYFSIMEENLRALLQGLAPPKEAAP